ncbi:hypothetical protein HII31_11942 [Pseudocercospora fuligena]|uniref:Uncharacterized protein n=1 Tax=Pseudocercospora fuligena TaxID=685502 RepID=A0A8H6VH74_9PEZI|nr:hypothetical protein HII31_11942 [Pseudocercospora fuligena]
MCCKARPPQEVKYASEDFLLGLLIPDSVPFYLFLAFCFFARKSAPSPDIRSGCSSSTHVLLSTPRSDLSEEEISNQEAEQAKGCHNLNRHTSGR